MIRAVTVGASVCALLVLATSWVAVRITDHIPWLAEDRGLLQFAVVTPFASIITAACVACFGVLTLKHLLWSVLPIAGLLLLAVAALGLGTRIALWTPVLSVLLLLPWLVGFLIGQHWLGMARRHRRRPSRSGARRVGPDH